jgi:queuine tRNA-ribosyltransferase
MGVGTPADIVGAVERGIDMFDCVMPTRSGRHGQAFTWTGKLNMRNAAHIEDPRPLDETSACPAARDYSRAYIHHLIRAGEYLAPMILSWANIAFYQELMATIRQSIREGNFETLAARVREAYPSTTVAEEAGAVPGPKRSRKSK